MSYGFTSISNAGFVQIDDLYSNYTLLQSGTVVNSGMPSAPAGSIIMVRLAINTIFHGFSGTYEYRIFVKKSSVASASGYGMKVMTGSSEVVFDSDVVALKIDFATMFLFNPAIILHSITVPSQGYLPWFVGAAASGFVRFFATGDQIRPTVAVGPVAIQNSDLSLTFEVRRVAAFPFFSDAVINPPQSTAKPIIIGP
jgi:hypothetical protein